MSPKPSGHLLKKAGSANSGDVGRGEDGGGTRLKMAHLARCLFTETEIDYKSY